MSPTKKKTKKTPAKKAARKITGKKATAKKVAKKAASKKATAKKAAKKTTKTASGKKAASKAKVPTAKKKASAPAKKTAAKTTKKTAAKRRAPAKVPKGKPVPISQIPHPKYGLKFECFSCSTRFYLMGKLEPVCPKCGADQRERPREAPAEKPRPKRPAVRPMAPLLDDDEDVATSEIDRTTRQPGAPDAMFDDAEAASVSEDTEEAPRPKAATDDD